MRIILIKEVERIGKAGEIKDVRAGYALNFLFPNNLAIPATPHNIEKIKREQIEQKRKEETRLKKINTMLAKLREETLEIKKKVGKDGRIFGAVTSKDIYLLLQKKGFDSLPKKAIRLKYNIHHVGEYSFYLSLPGIREEEIRIRVKGE
jgi:large subunit ribosomal protein L9